MVNPFSAMASAIFGGDAATRAMLPLSPSKPMALDGFLEVFPSLYIFLAAYSSVEKASDFQTRRVCVKVSHFPLQP